MIELKIEYPYNNGLIRHYAEDESGMKYHITQVETGIKYSEAVDVYPCRYHYAVTNEPVIEDVEEKVEIEKEVV
jgi:hypothetical protein